MINENGLFHYLAFGLKIASTVKIPELISCDTHNHDVIITAGNLSPADYQGEGKDYHYAMTQESFYLQIMNIGRYLATSGNSVIVDQNSAASARNVRAYLLGTVMAMILNQRGNLSLHGSAIATSGGCALFLGERGIGKSTLLMALQKLGYPVVSDDICAVSCLDDRNIVVHPSYPRIKLCRDVALSLLPQEKRTASEWDDEGKIAVMVQQTFQPMTIRLAKIFFLEISQGGETEIHQLSGHEKFVRLKANIFRDEMVYEAQLIAHQFRICSLICSSSEMFTLRRSIDLSNLPRTTEILSPYL